MTEGSSRHEIREPAPRQKVSPEDRQRALQARVEKASVLSTTDRSYPELVRYYAKRTKMGERQLPDEDLTAISGRLGDSLRSSALQCPEYRDAIADERSPKRADSMIGVAKFDRGEHDFRIHPIDYWRIMIVTEEGYESGEFDYPGKLIYSISEKVASGKERFLHEQGTIEAVAGVESMIQRLRDSGVLDNGAPELVASEDSLWKKIVDSQHSLRAGVLTAVYGGFNILTDASLKQYAALGVSSAVAGFLGWKEIKETSAREPEKVQELINRGEFAWGSFKHDI